MKPAQFAYRAPETLDEALDLLDELGGDARILAGGQSLMPLLNMRLLAPECLVDINRILGLGKIDISGSHVRLPALVRQAAVEDDKRLAEVAPILARTIRYVGHRVTRTRGTVVGSIAHADPAAELPALFTALGADAVLASKEAERRVPVADLLEAPFAIAKNSNELLLAVEFSMEKLLHASIYEVSRRHGDYAMCGAVATRWDGDPGARLAFFGLSSTVVTLNVPDDPSEVANSVEEFLDGIDVAEDIHADVGYRRRLAVACAERVLADMPER